VLDEALVVLMFGQTSAHDACCNALSGALDLILADGCSALRGHRFPLFCRSRHVSYASRRMRGAALLCYCISSERTTLAAVDAVNRSL
jgi:hypothetical protein